MAPPGRDAKRPLLIIGWNEFVDVPEWGIRRLRAKVDTGARSSALHVEDIEELSGGRVRFDVVLHRRRRDRRVHVVTRVRRRGRVRSSNGQFEHRLFVEVPVRIGPVEKRVELSLVDRRSMIHRMLLGRTALADDFLIDVSHRCLLTGPRAPERAVVEKPARRRKTGRGAR